MRLAEMNAMAQSHKARTGIEKITGFLRTFGSSRHGVHARHHFESVAVWLERLLVAFIQLELAMGKAAEAIVKLENALSAERTKSAHLTAERDAALANSLDPADLAAIDGVDAAVAGDTGAVGDSTTVVGTGPGVLTLGG